MGLMYLGSYDLAVQRDSRACLGTGRGVKRQVLITR
jgi:hypothetical protein